MSEDKSRIKKISVFIEGENVSGENGSAIASPFFINYCVAPVDEKAEFIQKIQDREQESTGIKWSVEKDRPVMVEAFDMILEMKGYKYTDPPIVFGMIREMALMHDPSHPVGCSCFSEVKRLVRNAITVDGVTPENLLAQARIDNVLASAIGPHNGGW